MSQSQYDALLSLYFDTGTINTIGTQARLFQITDFINNRQWDYVATAMTLAGENRLMRQQEAKVLMLADYGITKDRSLIKEQGLQTLLKITVQWDWLTNKSHKPSTCTMQRQNDSYPI